MTIRSNDWITKGGGGIFRSRHATAQRYTAACLPEGGCQIYFCNAAHLATIGRLISGELFGTESAQMYDGSMVDWTSDPAAPVEQKVKFE